MNRTCWLLINLSLMTACFSFAQAQSITGNTTLNTQTGSGGSSATCETDLDASAQSFYNAIVTCVVTDGAGAQVAEGQYIDQGGILGFAMTTVYFTANEGSSYTAVGTHAAKLEMSNDYAEGTPQEYDDYYNFVTGGEGVGSVPHDTTYTWYGPGPDTPAYANTIYAGNTTKKVILPPTVVVKFSGVKTAGDHLSFLQLTNSCSESLGLFNCNYNFPHNVEISAVVDDASRWAAKQTLLSETSTYYRQGSTTAITSSATNVNDDPISSVIQATAGTKQLFWIDGPGAPKTDGSGFTVDSVTLRQNFQSSVCSKDDSSVCGSVAWYAVSVVSSGSQLQPSQSPVGNGTAP